MLKFISCDSNQNNVTTEYIRDLEEKLGIVFPNVLVDYYTNHNKAELKEISFCIHNLEFSVEFIIPLHIRDCMSGEDFVI